MEFDLKYYCDIYNKIRYHDICLLNSVYKKTDLCDSEYYFYVDQWNSLSSCDRDYVRKFLNNRYHKKARIYNRIEFMLNAFPVCYFCTFTLNDESINLSLKYLKYQLTQMLKSLNCYYLGNVDFGEKFGRLHFHVIIAENDVHICKANINWEYGFSDICVICNKDEKRLGSYIMKLVNHANKKTTKDSIICPRGEFSFAKLKL